MVLNAAEASLYGKAWRHIGWVFFRGRCYTEVVLMGNMDMVWRGLAARLSPNRRPGCDELAFLEIYEELVAQGYCS